jgi:AraC-like DNA-binding protein
VVTSGAQTSSASSPTLASPGRSLNLEYRPNLEKVFVSFQSKALKQKLTALLGTPVSRDLEFKLAEFTSHERLNDLIDLIKIILRQVDRRNSPIVPWVIRELEDAAVVQLLFTGLHQLTGQLLRKPPETSPNVIARAEQFIEANWKQPITMEALTEVTGVSGRTLLRSFTKVRGYSPMAFARKVRFEHARRLLSEPNANTTVTGVALACGFSNLGRFAEDYRNVFGELPSKTLKKALNL